MKIQTFSILVGGSACNAQCPICISKTTVPIKPMPPGKINIRNFEIACRLARQSGCTTVMLTGKGEPTLYPSDIQFYMRSMATHCDFPFIELQTNGLLLQDEDFQDELKIWYEWGLTTVAISIVHWANNKNNIFYCPDRSYPKIGITIDMLHDIGLSVRLNCTLLKGYIDNAGALATLVNMARVGGVEQLTIRNANYPHSTPFNKHGAEVLSYIHKNRLSDIEMAAIKTWLYEKGDKLFEEEYGPNIFDLGGQNVYLTDCMTEDKGLDEIRNLIFHPDGHLYYRWDYEGAKLL